MIAREPVYVYTARRRSRMEPLHDGLLAPMVVGLARFKCYTSQQSNGRGQNRSKTVGADECPNAQTVLASG